MDKFKKGMKRLLKDKSIKIIIVVFIAIIVLFAVVSFSNRVRQERYEADGQDPLKVDESGNITGENITGLRESQLEAGSYYILHNDRFYPLLEMYMANFKSDSETMGSSTYRVLMTTVDYGKTIPTLYLGNNDSLIYYNPKILRSYDVLERFTDEGISVGVYNFNYDNISGYYSFSVDPENEISSIFLGSSAAQLLSGATTEDTNKERTEKEEKDKEVLFFTMTDIGGVKMARDQIKSTGIIKNLEPGASYETSIYNGTNYNKYTMEADSWYFTGLEAYAISDVPLGKRSFQTIVIPEYLKDGYYTVHDSGMFRLVRGTSWNTNMDFSTRLLATNQEEKTNNSESNDALKKSKYFEPEITTARYSENPELNVYKTKNPAAFGYVAETDTKTETETIDYERHDGEIPQKIGESNSASKPADNNSGREESENKTSATSSSSSSKEAETSAGNSGENSAASSQETNGRRTRE